MRKRKPIKSQLNGVYSTDQDLTEKEKEILEEEKNLAIIKAKENWIEGQKDIYKELKHHQIIENRKGSNDDEEGNIMRMYMNGGN